MSDTTHRHNYGEELSRFFVVQVNSDSTEGRGHMVDAGTFEDPISAHKHAKGKAVMGVGDGDIVLRTYNRCTECPEILRTDVQIYVGDTYSKRNSVGKIGRYQDFMSDGWRRDYSPLNNNPEYAEYLRLKKKFEA